MAHAYTPGLKVLHEAHIIKERRLPIKGQVCVQNDVHVLPDTVVATTNLPGNVQIVNVANQLNIDVGDIGQVMKKKETDPVSKGEIIAESKGLFGMFKTQVNAPVDGTIETISSSTGQVVIREAPIPISVDAYISGQVKEIIPEEGVTIESTGVFIQGIFGIGGENRGEIFTVVNSREDEISPEMLTPDMKGKVIVGGSFISLEAYKKAISIGIAGVVVGGFNYYDLKAVLGYTLGVAITGSEDLGTSLIVTEGYGKIKMGHRTFDLLKKFNSHFASVNGATQIRAGVIRPEIVIPLTNDLVKGDAKHIHAASGITNGSLVRVIRSPYFGQMGKVLDLPPELRKMESETMVRTAIIEINNDKVEVPRSNLELVETD